MLGLQPQGPLSRHRGCWQQRRESSPGAVPAPMSPGSSSLCPGGETKAGALVAVTRQLWWCRTGAPAAEPWSFQAEQPFWGLCRGCSPPGVTWLWPSSRAASPCSSHELGAEVLPPGRVVQAERCRQGRGYLWVPRAGGCWLGLGKWAQAGERQPGAWEGVLLAACQALRQPGHPPKMAATQPTCGSGNAGLPGPQAETPSCCQWVPGAGLEPQLWQSQLSCTLGQAAPPASPCLPSLPVPSLQTARVLF